MTTTITARPELIEAELANFVPPTSDGSQDPLVHALRQRGFRSVSIGLRTAQIDGVLYELCPVSQATIAAWLAGDPLPGPRTVRLARRSLAPGPKRAHVER
jgi:hypothetical protein